MHSSLSTRTVQRRSAVTHCASAQASSCMMQLTVDASAITLLRQLVMRVCGDALEFMRIASCANHNRMKVWLCVAPSMVAQVMDAVIRTLPGAEFGKLSGAMKLQ